MRSLMLFLFMLAFATTAQAWQQPFSETLGLIERGELDRAAARLDAMESDAQPLRAYLEYRLLTARMRGLDEGDVWDFLARWPELYLADNLRADFLHELARRGDWEAYARWFEPETDRAVTLRCHKLRAERELARPSAEWGERARELWLSGASRPSACDPAFDVLYDEALLTADDRRQRIALAYEQGNEGLARFLARDQSPAVRGHLRRWEAARADPARFLRDEMANGDPDDANPWRNDIRVQAFRWAARQDVASTVALAERIPERWRLSESERGRIWREIGLRAAWRHYPDAYRWLSRVPEVEADEAVRVWRVRAALRVQDWASVRAAIDGLTAREREDAEWRYWAARALAQTGQRDEAERIYGELAKEPDYYGMLAADQLGAPYALWHPEPRFVAAQRRAMADRSGMTMARAFREAGMIREARLQWNHCMGRLDRDELELAAELADELRWHDRAAVAVGRLKRAGGDERLDLRYPLPWRETVEKLSEREGVPSTWVYGVMRRESLFMHDVSSSAGAIGLMQLMPATAEWIGGRRGLEHRRDRLVDIDTNLALGTAYLNYLTDRFGGHKVLATAAYNAGQGRVRQWLPAEPLPADIWIDTMPFTETREYARAVFNAAAIFDWRMNGEARPLAEWMVAVDPRRGD